MLGPRRARLERLPLLTVLLLSGGLVTWAVLGAAPRGAAFLAAAESARVPTVAGGQPLAPSDVPGLYNEPSELVRELVRVALDGARSATQPTGIAGLEDLPGGGPEGAQPAAEPVRLHGNVQGDLVNGLPEGRWIVFHETGEPLAEGRFSGGLPEGPWSWFNPDGSLQLEGEFHAGLPTGRWRRGDATRQLLARGPAAPLVLASARDVRATSSTRVEPTGNGCSC